MKQFPRDTDPLLRAAEQAWADRDVDTYEKLVYRWLDENNYYWNGKGWINA